MEKIIIHNLGPIKDCTLEIKDFTVFTGPQASGKSTIAKSVFFFKNIKRLLVELLDKRFFLHDADNKEQNLKNQLIREIRSKFLQTFGSTWCMERDMFMVYHYSTEVSIKISLRSDPISYNYVWIEMSSELYKFLINYNNLIGDKYAYEQGRNKIIQDIKKIFSDDLEAVYIPAGRSMMTLFSSQLMYLYNVMSDDQKRSLDYCTQNYLEKTMQIKPFFNESIRTMIKNEYETSITEIDKENLLLCEKIMKEILQGEYRNVDGEERLQVSDQHYVKINFASSGQQEAVWILNVVFYYLLKNKKVYFIIEEPESHLFPNTQKLMTEFISLAKNDGSKIFMTTHSPYVLGTINNLLYANKISKKADIGELNSIINKNKWLDFQKLSAYYIEDGKMLSCVDQEMQAINNEVIDGASDAINRDFDAMVELKYRSEMDGE